MREWRRLVRQGWAMENFATVRLIAEKLDQTHLIDLTRMHLDPEVSHYLGGVRSPEATKTYLDVNLAHWAEHGFGLWVLRTRDGAFAGRAGLRHIELESAREVEIAYSLVRTHWDQGLATEIAGALINLWLTELHSPSLVGVVSVENTASRRVLEKSGFAFERTGIYHDTAVVIFRRTRPVHSCAAC
jgi:RimJ/RimL family protein N-acetyltransferase